MRFIDLFAGIGGFRYGLEKTNSGMGRNRQKDIRLSRGQKAVNSSRSDIPQTKRPNRRIINDSYTKTYKCVYSNEWDKYATQIYKKHYGECDTRDITTIKSSEIPDHDLLVGGFPCQAFSIAGKRAGFNDTRGTLFFEIARILHDKRPRYFLLENVKGLLSHDSGKTFQTILGVLSDLGYEYQWQVLNSKNFGVPQNRERVFIVGNLRGTPRPKVFPIGESNQISNEKSKREAQRTHPIRSGYKAGQGGNDFIIHNVYGGFKEEIREFHKYSPTIRTPKGGGHLPMVVEDFYPNRVRRLTPTECCRLQGFPDDWVDGISDTQKYKCLGNAVTTNVVTEIGRRLI